MGSPTKPAEVPAWFWQRDVAESKITGADPYLLAAIAQHETQFGTLGVGRQGILGYDVIGANGPNAQYAGVDNQLYYAGLMVKKFFKGQPITAKNLQTFDATTWRAADPTWAQDVWRSYSPMWYLDPQEGAGGVQNAITHAAGAPWSEATNFLGNITKVDLTGVSSSVISSVSREVSKVFGGVFNRSNLENYGLAFLAIAVLAVFLIGYLIKTPEGQAAVQDAIKGVSA